MSEIMTNRRKARAIPPAKVTIEQDRITVLVADVLGKNEAHRRGRGITYLSTAAKRYREAVRLGGPRGDSGWPLPLWSFTGPVEVVVTAAYPTRQSKHRWASPVGDSDGAISQALDAMEHAGIIDNDDRVVSVTGRAIYRKGERWTRIEITPWKGELPS